MARLYLKLYPSSSNGRFIDGSEQVIEECLFSNELVEFIGPLSKLPQLQVHFDAESSDSTTYPCLLVEEAEKLATHIRETIVSIQVGDTQLTEHEQNDPLELIWELRNLCNALHTIWLKQTNFGDDQLAILQLES